LLCRTSFLKFFKAAQLRTAVKWLEWYVTLFTFLYDCAIFVVQIY
jgi:hypothetical protein